MIKLIFIPFYMLFFCSSLAMAKMSSDQIFRTCKTGQTCICKGSDEKLVIEPYEADHRDWKEPIFIYRCKKSTNDINFMGMPDKPLEKSLKAPTLGPCANCEEEIVQTTTAEKIMAAIELFPTGCGYEWENFSTSGFKESIEELLTNDKILCDSKHKHMCTSAVFMAFLKTMKSLKQENKITEVQMAEFTKLDQTAWQYLNNLARPDVMVQKLNIGTGTTLEHDDLPQDDWPAPGDFLQIWRENDSGHSTVFTGYLNDEEGKPIGFCYWSSQPSTDGFGKKCEKFTQINKIHVGRITL